MQGRHHIDSNSFHSWKTCAEITGMPALQHYRGQRRHIDRLGGQVREGTPQALKILFVGDNGQVEVAAELGRSVQDARLTAHEQKAHAPLLDRRKDFDYRARDQVILLRQKM
jgi:hypothetical protein